MSWAPAPQEATVSITLTVPAAVAKALQHAAGRVETIKPAGCAITAEAVVLMVGALATHDLCDADIMQSIFNEEHPE